MQRDDLTWSWGSSQGHNQLWQILGQSVHVLQRHMAHRYNSVAYRAACDVFQSVYLPGHLGHTFVINISVFQSVVASELTWLRG